MSLKLSKLQGCVLKYSNCLLSNVTDVAWQHCCCATCQIFKRLENSRYQSQAFCYWLKMNNTLRYCCFIVISDHILYGPPKGYTDHPAIHRGWSVGRPTIRDFGQHCYYGDSQFYLPPGWLSGCGISYVEPCSQCRGLVLSRQQAITWISEDKGLWGWLPLWHWPGVDFTNDFSIVIQNLMEISLCSHSNCSEFITMKFCTWHGSYAVVARVKFCSHMMPYTRVTLKQIFHQISITMEKSIVKWTHQSGTKPNLVAKILATKIGNLLAWATKIGSQH